jgi:hypothetical protein
MQEKKVDPGQLVIDFHHGVRDLVRGLVEDLPGMPWEVDIDDWFAISRAWDLTKEIISRKGYRAYNGDWIRGHITCREDDDEDEQGVEGLVEKAREIIDRLETT